MPLACAAVSWYRSRVILVMPVAIFLLLCLDTAVTRVVLPLWVQFRVAVRTPRTYLPLPQHTLPFTTAPAYVLHRARAAVYTLPRFLTPSPYHAYQPPLYTPCLL